MLRIRYVEESPVAMGSHEKSRLAVNLKGETKRECVGSIELNPSNGSFEDLLPMVGTEFLLSQPFFFFINPFGYSRGHALRLPILALHPNLYLLDSALLDRSILSSWPSRLHFFLCPLLPFLSKICTCTFAHITVGVALTSKRLRT